jgi:HEPN domain-containing protein
MRPFSLYQVAYDGFLQLQTNIVGLIEECMPVDRIYLLGGSLMRQRRESVFNQDAPTLQYLTDPYCLVLVSSTNGKSLVQLQDQLEQHCALTIPVTVLLLNTHIFEGWLSEGHSFAIRVFTTAPLIVHNDAGFNASLHPIDTEKEKRISHSIYKEGVKKMEEFMAGAELYLLRKYYSICLFMLHQAIEQGLSAILKGGTGFHTCTHNTERLLKLSAMVTSRTLEVFSRNTEPEKRVFSLLQKAYVDSRYKQNYSIAEKDILLIRERVSQIQNILRELESSCQ